MIYQKEKKHMRSAYISESCQKLPMFIELINRVNTNHMKAAKQFGIYGGLRFPCSSLSVYVLQTLSC